MENLKPLWDDITKRLLWAIIVLVFSSSLMAFKNTATLSENTEINKEQTSTLNRIKISMELLKMDLGHTKNDLEKHVDRHE